MVRKLKDKCDPDRHKYNQISKGVIFSVTKHFAFMILFIYKPGKALETYQVFLLKTKQEAYLAVCSDVSYTLSFGHEKTKKQSDIFYPSSRSVKNITEFRPLCLRFEGTHLPRRQKRDLQHDKQLPGVCKEDVIQSW